MLLTHVRARVVASTCGACIPCIGAQLLIARPSMGWDWRHCLQDVSGGKPVRLQGTELPLYGMEIDVAAAAEEIRSIGKESDGSQVRDAHVS